MPDNLHRLIGMEAFSGAHHWPRLFQAQGHTIGIMASKFVTPFRKGVKMMAMMLSRLLRPLPPPRQCILSLSKARSSKPHCACEGLVQDRTAQVNRFRGLLSEFGIIIPQGFGEVIPVILADTDNALLALARRLLHDARGHLEHIHQQVLAYDREIEAIARLNEKPGD